MGEKNAYCRGLGGGEEAPCIITTAQGASLQANPGEAGQERALTQHSEVLNMKCDTRSRGLLLVRHHEQCCSVDEKVKGRIHHIREYGEEHGIPQLATDQWHGHEVDGWEMTSIAGYLLGAKGLYRTPKDNGFTCMLMMDVRWAS